MTTARIDQAVIAVVAVSNLVLAWLLFVSLRTTPGDVHDQIALMRTEMQNANQLFRDDLDAVSVELDKRGVWIAATDAELDRRTRDRVYRSQVIEWQQQFRALNPGVQVPELPELQPTSHTLASP